MTEGQVRSFLTQLQKHDVLLNKKIDKLCQPKLKKKFYSVKEHINRMKREATDWEKILANHISNKGFVSRIYIEHSKFKR